MSECIYEHKFGDFSMLTKSSKLNLYMYKFNFVKFFEQTLSLSLSIAEFKK